MENLITALMLWIGANTNYDTSSLQHPDVVLLSPKQMTTEYYSGAGVSLPVSGIDTRVLALYNHEKTTKGVIYLLDPRLNSELEAETLAPQHHVKDLAHPLTALWLEHPVFQEQLLHELIHHVQFKSGAVDRMPCIASSEKEAYLLGGRYLKLRHVTDPLPNRSVLAHMYSRC